MKKYIKPVTEVVSYMAEPFMEGWSTIQDEWADGKQNVGFDELDDDWTTNHDLWGDTGDDN